MKPLIFILILSSTAYSQHRHFNTKRNWSLNKKDLFFGAGITQFTGDVGGINKLGPNYGISDLNWPSTGWNVMVGYRFRFHPYWATNSRIRVGQLQGNDALKIDDHQRSRNLHFKSSFMEFSQRIECLIMVNEKLHSRYSLRRRPKRYYQLSLQTGVGLLYYEPKANYEGDWIDLHPQRTEGQGLPGGPKPYSLYTATLPVGIAFRYELNMMWRIGLEAEYIFTFTDYLDDVGGNYYDPEQLANKIGEASAYLSNPSIQNNTTFATGQPRGDDRLDGFFSVMIQFNRNFTYRNYYRKRNKAEDESMEEE